MVLTIVKGITAVQDESGASFTGGTITNSTINSTSIGGTTPSTGSFTTVSAQSAIFTGDVRVSGKVTVGQAVSAASFNAVGVVSAGGDINTAANFVAGARTAVVSGDTGNITAAALSLSGIVSAASVNITGDVRALTGAVLASAATFTAAVTANSLHVNTTISAAGDINTLTNFVAGNRLAVVSGDTGNITAAAGSFTSVSASTNLTVNGNASFGATSVVVSGDSGRILNGALTGIGFENAVAQIQVLGSAVATASIGIGRFINSSLGPVLFFAKSRSPIVGTASAALNSDFLGRVSWDAATNSGTYVQAAEIAGLVEGTPGTGCPARIVMSTVNSAFTLTEAVRINASQQVTVANDLIFTVGSGAIQLSTIASGQGAQAATLLTSPVAGNPSFWIPVKVNGVIRYIPSW